MSASDGYWKAAHTRCAPPYTATHHPHRAIGTVNTSDTFPDAHAVQSSLGRVIMALPQHFWFLGITLYGFLQYQLPLVISRSFWQIRPTEWGFPDCSSHLGNGIIITVSNELQPKLFLESFTNL
ncbi:hypothetical protein [Microcoleus sp. B9-D4]|uniref:hypothetical protein n=1 Tax=Microcoleus sp. B9-D4 TaxID=2818711 RepID=UPI002FD416EA